MEPFPSLEKILNVKDSSESVVGERPGEPGEKEFITLFIYYHFSYMYYKHFIYCFNTAITHFGLVS